MKFASLTRHLGMAIAAFVVVTACGSTSGGGTASFEHLEGVFLVSAWFRRHPGERALAMQPDAALQLAR